MVERSAFAGRLQGGTRMALPDEQVSGSEPGCGGWSGHGVESGTALAELHGPRISNGVPISNGCTQLTSSWSRQKPAARSRVSPRTTSARCNGCRCVPSPPELKNSGEGSSGRRPRAVPRAGWPPAPIGEEIGPHLPDPRLGVGLRGKRRRTRTIGVAPPICHGRVSGERVRPGSRKTTPPEPHQWPPGRLAPAHTGGFDVAGHLLRAGRSDDRRGHRGFCRTHASASCAIVRP